MFWYLVLAFFPIVLSLIVNAYYKSSIKTDCRAKRTFLVWCGIALFLIIALRSKNVGSSDSLRYFTNWDALRYITYENLEKYINNSIMEKGYLISVWILSHIFPNPQFLFIITGILFSIAVCKFIYVNSDDPQLSFIMFICLGLYSFMVQGLRQAIAMSICLFAFEYCKKRKLFKFILVVLFASLFHHSAIVFLIVYLIYGFTINIESIIVSVIVGIATIKFAPILADFANTFFEREYEGTVENGGFVASAIYIILLFAAIFLSGSKKNDKNFSFFVFVTFIGLYTYLIRYFEVLAAERISFYFMFGQIIILPGTLNRFDKKIQLILKSVVIILSIILFTYRATGEGLAPYYFFWQI